MPQHEPVDRPWDRYRPDARRPWDLRLAGHLFRRAGFGAAWPQLRQAVADGPQATIDKLLRPEGDVASFQGQFDSYEAAASRSDSADLLRAWWLRRMLLTPHPLLERMTLFWHGHFAVSHARVQNAPLLHQHLKLLRSHALGRFDQLLTAIARDPAVLVALGGAANRRAMPAHRFAETLLGPFTLGQNQCSAGDVREAARAFTGQFVEHGQFRFIEREHDPTPKTFLGQRGNWNGDDVIRILLRQPLVATRIVRALYRWLISETDTPDDALLTPLVESFAADYDTGRLIETMLRSNQFFSAAAYRRRVKGPVEFALGIVRGLQALVPTTALADHLVALGQNLCHPPTDRGWPGGPAWITRATLTARFNLARALLAGEKPYGNAVDPLAIARKHDRGDARDAGAFLLDLFLQGDLPPAVAALVEHSLSGEGDLDRRIRRLACAIVTLPEFQLS